MIITNKRNLIEKMTIQEKFIRVDRLKRGLEVLGYYPCVIEHKEGWKKGTWYSAYFLTSFDELKKGRTFWKSSKIGLTHFKRIWDAGC